MRVARIFAFVHYLDFQMPNNCLNGFIQDSFVIFSSWLFFSYYLFLAD